MSKTDFARAIYQYPEKIGISVGFEDLKEIHGEWIREMVWGDGDYTLMAHRAAYKSSCLAVAISLMMVFYPTKNIIFLRKADNDVSEMIRMVNKILKSQVLIDICAVMHGVSLELTEDSQDHISTNLWTSPMGAAQLLGIGIKSSITGKHSEIVITDDICNVNDRTSKAERDKTKLQYQELQNIRNRGGRIINLGTKWHKDDVFTLMDNIHVYDYKKTGLISDKQLEKIKRSMTASLFACNYELRIIAAEDVIFDNPHTGADPAMVEQGECHIDAAFYGEDYTAFTVMKKHDGKYYVYGKMWRKHVEDCYAVIMQDYERFMCRSVSLETNADKGMVGKELKKMGLRVKLYSEHMNKYLKIVTYLKAIWKDVIFVEGTDVEYINQICDFNEDCEHDDAADSCASLARILYRRNSNSEEYTPILG